MKKLKRVAVCLNALLVLSVVAAATAHAAEYHGTSAPDYLSGLSSDNVITITHSPTNVTIKCATTSVSGSLFTTSAVTVSLLPTYSGCTLNGVKATVNPKGCEFRLNQPTGAGPFSATVNITCASSAPITVTSTGCTVTIPDQGPRFSTTITNSGAPNENILLSLNLSSIRAEQSFGCPGGYGTFSTTDYTGTMRVTGTNGVFVA